jgi:hypothetical protein
MPAFRRQVDSTSILGSGVTVGRRVDIPHFFSYTVWLARMQDRPRLTIDSLALASYGSTSRSRLLQAGFCRLASLCRRAEWSCHVAGLHGVCYSSCRWSFEFDLMGTAIEAREGLSFVYVRDEVAASFMGPAYVTNAGCRSLCSTEADVTLMRCSSGESVSTVSTSASTAVGTEP